MNASPENENKEPSLRLNHVYCPLVDTHAHINLDEFQDDLGDLITRSRQGVFPPVRGKQVANGTIHPFMSGLICPAVDLQTSKRAVELARRYSFIFAALGVHPNHTSQIQEREWDEIVRLVDEETLAANQSKPIVVALGETGLDRYWDDAPFELQLQYFLKTLELSKEKKLPVIIHSREANEDLDSILHDFYGNCPSDRPVGVVHSFSGTPEQAQRLIDLGFYLGFGGFVTYTSKKFADLWNVARSIPLDRILLETDSPFLTPHPLRGKIDRNEPLLTAFVARRIAELRDLSTAEIARATRQNAINLFRLPPLSDYPEKE
ncbi:MAG: TatD family hydrolase [Thermoguttaceae bacterium]